MDDLMYVYRLVRIQDGYTRSSTLPTLLILPPNLPQINHECMPEGASLTLATLLYTKSGHGGGGERPNAGAY